MNPADPWHARVAVAQIPEVGLHCAFEASQAVREAMAKIAGLREILVASASFDIKPKSGGRIHVTGRVQARIGQVCVVTLEPIENAIDEAIDLVFAPAEHISGASDLADHAAESDQMREPPEPIVDGVIDLGRLATDALFLAVDPYPRRADAVFERKAEVIDPDDHPFAALKALQSGDPSARAKAGAKPPKDGKR